MGGVVVGGLCVCMDELRPAERGDGHVLSVVYEPVY